MSTSGVEAYIFVDSIMCDSCRGNIKAQVLRIVGVEAVEYPFVTNDAIRDGDKYLKVTYDLRSNITPDNIAKQIRTIEGPYFDSDQKYHQAAVVEKPSPRIRYGY